MLTLQFLKLDENLLNSGIIEKEKFVMNNYFDFVNIYTIAGFMPVALILAAVILKIYFSKKFKNKLFYAILIILLLYSSAVYSIIFFMTAVQDNSTFLQHNNIALGGFLTSLYPSVFVVSVLILVIMVTGTTIYYVKTKDKNFIDDYLNCEFLFIDDLGTEVYYRNSTDQNIYNILNDRQIKKLCTIITTNLDLAEIKEKYGERTFSRITNKDVAILVNLKGEDLRINKK